MALRLRRLRRGCAMCRPFWAPAAHPAPRARERLTDTPLARMGSGADRQRPPELGGGPGSAEPLPGRLCSPAAPASPERAGRLGWVTRLVEAARPALGLHPQQPERNKLVFFVTRKGLVTSISLLSVFMYAVSWK